MYLIIYIKFIFINLNDNDIYHIDINLKYIQIGIFKIKYNMYYDKKSKLYFILRFLIIVLICIFIFIGM